MCHSPESRERGAKRTKVLLYKFGLAPPHLHGGDDAPHFHEGTYVSAVGTGGQERVDSLLRTDAVRYAISA